MTAPTKRGFGTTLIEQSAKGVSGTAHLTIAEEGVSWEITLPLPRLPASAARFDGPTKPGTADKPASDGASKSAGARSTLAGKRVLIVEDEPLVALDIVSNLEEAGVETVGPVGSTPEALALIERLKLDAALLDANLHGQPVGEIAAALTRKGVPFAFVTGYGREGLPEAFARAEILAKPFSQDQLLQTASKLVDAYSSIVKLRS